jgi:hypothetical protein
MQTIQRRPLLPSSARQGTQHSPRVYQPPAVTQCWPSLPPLLPWHAHMVQPDGPAPTGIQTVASCKQQARTDSARLGMCHGAHPDAKDSPNSTTHTSTSTTQHASARTCADTLYPCSFLPVGRGCHTTHQHGPLWGVTTAAQGGCSGLCALRPTSPTHPHKDPLHPPPSWHRHGQEARTLTHLPQPPKPHSLGPELFHPAPHPRPQLSLSTG